MSGTFIIIALIIGLIIGTAVGHLITSSKHRAQEETLQATNNMLQSEIERLKSSERERYDEMLAVIEKNNTEQLAALEKKNAEQLAALEKKNAEQLVILNNHFNETTEKVSAQMRDAANTMLKERQKEFSESSNQNIGQIVNPLRESITQMRKAMDESTQKQTTMGAEMKVTIEHMMHQSEAARRSAEELTRVFKHGSKIQGDWGETILDELLTAQGLRRGIHYSTQEVIRDGNGNVVHTDTGGTMRPDVIMHLDQRRELIIDSKVSLTAFIDYVNADNEADRERSLRAHIDSINKHVKELSAKDYSTYIQAPKVCMGYVIMFVPHTGALWTALNAQPDLWRRAMEKNVFIADEQTLFAALKIINLTWTQITQVQQHEKLYKLAEEMIDRVGMFLKRYDAVGANLRRATEAYDDAKKKLEPQGQSILNTATKLVKLGAKNSTKNPIPELTDIDEIPQLTDNASNNCD